MGARGGESTSTRRADAGCSPSVGRRVSEHANGPRVESISLPAPLVLDDVVGTDRTTELLAKIAHDRLTESGDTLAQRLLSNVQDPGQVAAGNGRVLLPCPQLAQIQIGRAHV